MNWDPIMRPKPKTWDGRVLHGDVQLEVKLDGYRLTVERREDGILAYGRNKVLELPDTLRARLSRFPAGTVLDGELLAIGKPATEVASLLAQQSRMLTFAPFAVPFYAGRDERYCAWARLDEMLREHGYEPLERLPYAQHHTPEKLRDRALELGVEGFVIKQFQYANWWKIKGVETVDLVVVGVKPGKGKHAGRNGSMVCALADGTIVASVGKGGDDQWRDAPESALVGRVIEVSHEGVQSQGKLKFSSFVRFREDKHAHECVSL